MGTHLNAGIVTSIKAHATDNIKNGRLPLTREFVESALMSGPRATPPRKKTVRRYMNALRKTQAEKIVRPGPHRDYSVQGAPDTRDDKYLHSAARMRRHFERAAQ